MGKLDNKIALITGSSSGIGKAVALALCRRGGRPGPQLPELTPRPITPAAVQKDIEALGRRVVAIRADVSQEDEVQHLVDTTRQTYGRIDILVNNAGYCLRRNCRGHAGFHVGPDVGRQPEKCLSVYAPGLTTHV